MKTTAPRQLSLAAIEDAWQRRATAAAIAAAANESIEIVPTTGAARPRPDRRPGQLRRKPSP